MPTPTKIFQLNIYAFSTKAPKVDILAQLEDPLGFPRACASGPVASPGGAEAFGEAFGLGPVRSLEEYQDTGEFGGSHPEE